MRRRTLLTGACVQPEVVVLKRYSQQPSWRGRGGQGRGGVRAVLVLRRRWVAVFVAARDQPDGASDLARASSGVTELDTALSILTRPKAIP